MKWYVLKDSGLMRTSSRPSTPEDMLLGPFRSKLEARGARIREWNARAKRIAELEERVRELEAQLGKEV